MLRTAEQRRASETWLELTDTERFGADPGQWQANCRAKGYLTALRQTATRIYVSGLGQAIAYLRSRGDETPRQVAHDIAKLVLEQIAPNEHAAGDTALALIGVLREGDLILLMRATEEALGAVAWLSRYLQGADIEPDDVEEGDEGGEMDA